MRKDTAFSNHVLSKRKAEYKSQLKNRGLKKEQNKNKYMKLFSFFVHAFK